MSVKRIGDIPISIQGDTEHPANFGKVCSKGAALLDTLDLQHRLLSPKIDGQNVNWTTAIDYIAESLRRTIEKYGAEAVAFYVSGQLLLKTTMSLTNL